MDAIFSFYLFLFVCHYVTRALFINNLFFQKTQHKKLSFIYDNDMYWHSLFDFFFYSKVKS